MINYYSVIHFAQYFILGKYLLKNWWVFFIISIGWECIELVLPFQFAIESLENKFADIIINCLGFYMGISHRK